MDAAIGPHQDRAARQLQQPSRQPPCFNGPCQSDQRPANMVMVVSDDDGFSWTPPKWTNIWGFPPELIALQDGRYLMVYGYRRTPYGTRGIISEDGLTWDVKNEFIIREGGVPGKTVTDHAGLQPHVAGFRQGRGRRRGLEPSRRLSAHRLSKRRADAGRDGGLLLSRMERRSEAAAIRPLHAVPGLSAMRRTAAKMSVEKRQDAAVAGDRRILYADPHATAPIRISPSLPRIAGCWCSTARSGARRSCIRPKIRSIRIS